MLAITTTRPALSFTAAAWQINAISRQMISSSSSSSSSQRTRPLQMIYSSQRILPLHRPPDPSSFTNNTTDNESNYIQSQSTRLQNWLHTKKSILVITGAGMSTESGIPDYRGSNGSYFKGHKPIIHHDFMSNESSRKRYWARSLVGYSPFSTAQPNGGHEALARMEELGLIGVDLEEGVVGEEVLECLGESCYGSMSINNDDDGDNAQQQKQPPPRRLAIITQNVDILHSKGGSKHVLHLHGRGDIVRCMNCGVTRDRKEYHDHLSESNREWMEAAAATTATKSGMESGKKVRDNDGKKKKAASLRPDGDADWYQESYDGMSLPPCPHCGTAHDNNNINHQNGEQQQQQQQQQQSFYKTDVVFFGDSVPRHRFDIAYAAVDAADGILCIGTSLAVHSAYRLAKRALDKGTEVAILNVGETRIESEGLDSSTGLVTKIESPIGDTLAEVVKSYTAAAEK
eukprot:scaffold873_cov120-Skeletonema_marinoi.AAC.1